jgi:hypothetical protein
MATQPTTPQPKPKPKPEDDDDVAAAAPPTEPPAPPAPPSVQTIADEQRERSEQMMKVGIEAWKAEHDERSEADREPRQVPGISPRVNDPAIGNDPAHMLAGTPARPEAHTPEGARSTPPARAAQNRAAP